MGMEFSAILKCQLDSAQFGDAIFRLEKESPEEVRYIGTMATEFREMIGMHPRWIKRKSPWGIFPDMRTAKKAIKNIQKTNSNLSTYFEEMVGCIHVHIDRPIYEETARPRFPDYETILETRELFWLRFFQDSVWVYHFLPFLVFLRDPKWQVCMLKACGAFIREFAATEAVIVRHSSPIISALHNSHLTFDMALRQESEVPSLDALHIQYEDCWDSIGYYHCRDVREWDSLNRIEKKA